MTTQEKIELAAFIAARCKARPSRVASAVAKIANRSAALTRIGVREYNEAISKEQQARHDRCIKRSLVVVQETLFECGMGAQVKRGEDPRGWSMFILPIIDGTHLLEDVREYSNDIGQRGYGVG